MVGTHIQADFFDASNPEFLEQRTKVADATLADMVKWFESGNGGDKIAIMDATNTIYARRQIIRETLLARNISVIFVECIYENEGLINEYSQFLHLLSPDYNNMTSEQAQTDYLRRIQFYQVNYEPVDDRDGAYIKIWNGGQRLVVNNVYGYLPSKILFYLMNMHCSAKKIYLKTIPCDPETILQNIQSPELQVWTGPELTSSSAVSIKSLLTALNMADLEGLSEADIQSRFPDEYRKYKARPFYYRLPRCESYADLSKRLEPVMMELERLHSDVLILADISVIRCIYSYFVETSDLNVRTYSDYLFIV